MLIEWKRFKKAGRSASRVAGLVALGTGLLLTQASGADANSKYSGFVIDANNGHVLYDDRGDEQRYPASLTKMMTLYLTFDALKRGIISMDTEMPVSRYASQRPPSKLGLNPGSELSVKEAVYSIVTRSANDAAVVLAEYLGHSEDNFAKMMTAKAHQLGMSRTVFKNANGLPNSEQHTTARDMTTLGIALREHFPNYFPIFATRSYDFRGQRIGNHNRVLNRFDGVDGIKTGYINASGFNLVTSFKKDGKNVVAAVFGGRSGRSRDDHMVELLKRFVPKASVSSTGGEQLIASRDSLPNVQVAGLPKEGPVPDRRPLPSSIDARIALAYGTDEGAEVAQLDTTPRTPVGMSALKAALVQERPAMALQETTASHPFPMPLAPVPNGNAIDPRTTGSLVAAAAKALPASPWVVQIAATPGEDEALSILTKAKAAVGGPLASAKPFTETVRSGAQTLYRARFAGFSSKDQAWQACAALKRSSYNCYAVAN